MTPHPAAKRALAIQFVGAALAIAAGAVLVFRGGGVSLIDSTALVVGAGGAGSGLTAVRLRRDVQTVEERREIDLEIGDCSADVEVLWTSEAGDGLAVGHWRDDTPEPLAFDTGGSVYKRLLLDEGEISPLRESLAPYEHGGDDA